MEEVHRSLTKHIQTKEKAIRQFNEWDQLREAEIGKVITLCKEGKPFSTDAINEITEKMKQLGRENLLNFPERKRVNVQMVKEYIQKSEA
jgi:hypothetical protein